MTASEIKVQRILRRLKEESSGKESRKSSSDALRGKIRSDNVRETRKETPVEGNTVFS
ncbi:MAG TPA: hypothetical protein VJS44_17300 [Pyrinomonadaceae bacterium]|nr:hypothetical protein [Pyrinomonadaceae bacterium]